MWGTYEMINVQVRASRPSGPVVWGDPCTRGLGVLGVQSASGRRVLILDNDKPQSSLMQSLRLFHWDVTYQPGNHGAMFAWN